MQPHITTCSFRSADCRTRSTRILANSLFRELTSHGYSACQIIELASELLALLTAAIRSAAKKRQVA